MYIFDRVFLFIFLTGIVLLRSSAEPLADTTRMNVGIRFEAGLSWHEVLLKAKEERKFIFLDCYATWCGPCKFMSQKVFTQKAVADFMNEHFINVSVQMDRTDKDEELIKQWYKQADSIKALFSIDEYPTFLFFSPDGHVIHRFVGSTGASGEAFITKVGEALDPSKQYYSNVDEYKSHLKDSSFLSSALLNAIRNNDLNHADEIADAYLDCLKNPFVDSNLYLLRASIQSSKSQCFSLFIDNTTRIDSILGRPDAAERTVAKVLYMERIMPLEAKSDFPLYWTKITEKLKRDYPKINNSTIDLLNEVFEGKIIHGELKRVVYEGNAPVANWDSVSRQLQEEFPGYDPAKMISAEKLKYYKRKMLWRQLDTALLDYMQMYASQLDELTLNSVLWNYAFMHSDDQRILRKAIELCKLRIPEMSDTASLKKFSILGLVDTYANLLYKIGEKDQGIYWEEIVVKTADSLAFYPEPSKKSFRISLDRMKKGTETWVGRVGRYDEYQ